MKTLFLAFVIALSFAGQTTAAFAESPEKILKKAARALGGEKNLRRVSTTEATGRIARASDNASGEFRATAANPNLYAETFDLNGLETARGYNGKSAWTLDAENKLQTLTGAASRDFQIFAAYRAGARWLAFNKARVFSEGQTEIAGKRADAVVLVIAKNSRVKIYVDSQTNLPLREEFAFGDARKTFDYSDYRVVDGVSEPFAIAIADGAQNYQIKLDRVVHNEKTDAAIFDFPRVSTEPLPAVADLLKEVAANEDKVDEILENYTYIETQTAREVSDDGALREKEVEKRQVTFYKGYQIRRLLAKDGKPLSPDDARAEDRRAAEAIKEIEDKIAKRERLAAEEANKGKSARDQIGTSGERVSIGELLRASNLKNPRRERFRNRDVIVFDFEPNPNFDSSKTKSLLRFFGKTAGAIWIDERDKQVARVEASLIDNFNVAGGMVAKLKKGASFTLEQTRVNDEIWLPAVADINLSIKLLLVKGISINQLVRYTDYQKFKSEIKDATVGEPGKSTE